MTPQTIRGHKSRKPHKKSRLGRKVEPGRDFFIDGRKILAQCAFAEFLFITVIGHGLNAPKDGH